MSGPTAATYARRRATAVLALAAIVAIVLWIVLGGGGSGAPSRQASAVTHTSAARTRTRHASHRSAPAGLPLTGITPDHWDALTESPTARGEVSAARIGDDVYVVGGFDAAG